MITPDIDDKLELIYQMINEQVVAILAETQRWIPINKMLPRAGDEVLIWVADEEMTYLGYYNPHNKSWYDVIDDVLHGVTHWQSKPPPPEAT